MSSPSPLPELPVALMPHTLREAARDPAIAARFSAGLGLMQAVLGGELGPNASPSAEVWTLVERTVAIHGASVLSRLCWEDLALLDGYRKRAPGLSRALKVAAEQRVLPLLTRQGAGAADAADILQERLIELLAPIEGVRYGGVGKLTAWLAACCAHDWHRLRTRNREDPEADLAERLETELAMEDEAAILGRLYGGPLRASISEALTRLTPRHRTVLRMTLIDQLPAEQVGRAFGVKRVAVARWLGQIRADLRVQIGEVLSERYAVSSEDVSTLVRGLEDRLVISFARLLQSR